MEIKEAYKWGTTLFSVLPGVGVLITSIGVPPGYSHLLCGGIIEAFGVSTLLYIRINKEKIKSCPSLLMNQWGIFLLLFFMTGLLAYLFLYNSRFVHNIDYNETIFFPLWYSNELKELIVKAGSRNGAITSYGPAAIKSVIENGQDYLEITKIFLLSLYVLLLEVLIISLGLLGFRASDI